MRRRVGMGHATMIRRFKILFLALMTYLALC
jgi:hypothetical protein